MAPHCGTDILQLNINRPIVNLAEAGIASVVLLKLHGCVVSHIQVLAITLLSVHNIIKYSFCWTLTAERIQF